MRLHPWLVTALALLTTLGAISMALASSESSTQDNGVRALDGVWIYVEDRTEGREIEKQQPSMSTRVTLRVEEDAVVLVRSDGEIRMALDGSPTDVSREGSTSRYRGAWKDGVFEYESRPVREPGDLRAGGVIRWVLRVTDEGLIAGVESDSGWKSVALYRHPEGIALPTPAKAVIGDVSWLGDAWVGTRGAEGTTSIEERWSPPLGGSMFAISRTVSRDKLRAFEYLRIVERDGGLVYIAQPNGRAPTEFVLTELGEKRAVFENPRHDSPQRIVYELSAEGNLIASIGFAKGGRPQQFDYKRESR
jgi:hypothetical protein